MVEIHIRAVFQTVDNTVPTAIFPTDERTSPRVVIEVLSLDDTIEETVADSVLTTEPISQETTCKVVARDDVCRDAAVLNGQYATISATTH